MSDVMERHTTYRLREVHIYRPASTEGGRDVGGKLVFSKPFSRSPRRQDCFPVSLNCARMDYSRKKADQTHHVRTPAPHGVSVGRHYFLFVAVVFICIVTFGAAVTSPVFA